MKWPMVVVVKPRIIWYHLHIRCSPRTFQCVALILGGTYRRSTWSFLDNFRISEKSSCDFHSKFHQCFLFDLFGLRWLDIIKISTVLQPCINYWWCQHPIEDTDIPPSTFVTQSMQRLEHIEQIDATHDRVINFDNVWSHDCNHLSARFWSTLNFIDGVSTNVIGCQLSSFVVIQPV